MCSGEAAGALEVSDAATVVFADRLIVISSMDASIQQFRGKRME
jgi:hypothetical protein